jgi:DNA-binding MarR family transcriptional regulator
LPNGVSDRRNATMAAFCLGGLGEGIHSRVRLGTLAYLSTAGTVELQKLKRRLGVTDGNLASHIQPLEAAAYIVSEKRGVLEKRGAGRASVTRISLTDAGREALVRYLDTMERLAHAVRAGS